MKRLSVALLWLASLSLVGFSSRSTAATSVNWSYSLLTYGSPASWESPTAIDTGYSEYEYSWEMQWAEIRVMGSWYNAMPFIRPGDKIGDGICPGLPCTILDPLHIDYPEITADIYADVDSAGFAHVSIEDVSFGKHDGYSVTGFRYGSEIWGSGVPKPGCDFGLVRDFGASREFNKFFFDRDKNGAADVSFQFGSSNSSVLVGNWDGTKDNVGISIAYPPAPGSEIFQKIFLNTDTDPKDELSYQYGLNGQDLILGDWNGDGKTNVGLRIQKGSTAKYFLDHGNGRQDEESFVFGLFAWAFVAGDWDGPSVGGIEEHVGGVREQGGSLQWLLDTDDDGQTAEIIFTFGSVGEDPITGDFNGDGITDAGTIAVEPGGALHWYFDYNTPATRGGAAEESFVFGSDTDLLTVCDWDGDGDDNAGLIRTAPPNKQLFITNPDNTGPPEDPSIRFGDDTDSPCVGDFDGI